MNSGFPGPSGIRVLAGYLDLNLEAPELLRTALSYSGQGPFFRQLSGDPTYQDDGFLSVNSTLELGRVAPEGWGISMPVTVAYSRLTQDPTFLAQSDVRVDQVADLRQTGVSETRVEVGLRKTTPIGNRFMDPVLGGLSLRAGYSRSRATTTTLESKGSGVDARAEYFHLVGSRDFRMIPGFAEDVVRTLLPRSWEESLLEARFRWTPERIRMGTFYTRRDREAYRYEQILSLLGTVWSLPPVRRGKPWSHRRDQFQAPGERNCGADLLFDPGPSLPEGGRPGSARQPTPTSRERWPRIHRSRLGDQSGAPNPLWSSALSRFMAPHGLHRFHRLYFRPKRGPGRGDDPGPGHGPDSPAECQRHSYHQGHRLLGVEYLGRGPLRSQRHGRGFSTCRRAGAGEELGQPSAVCVRLLLCFPPGGLSSRFFRDPVSPGASYQLGWGDMDDFRFMNGDTASVLIGRRSWSGGTGVRLPLNLRVSGNYSDARTETVHTLSAMELRTRTWPDFRVALSEVELPEVARLFLDSVSVSSGYRKNSLETSYGGLSVQRRRMEERQVPLEVSGTWLGQITTRYQGTFTDGTGADPTGDTETRRRSHAFFLSSSVSEPPFLGDRLDGPLRLSVSYQYSSELNCRVPAGLPDCVPFINFRNRSVNATLDTVILPFEVGLHLTYTNRRSFVGRRDGSTQFQLGLFGQFLFNSGTFAAPSGAGVR